MTRSRAYRVIADTILIAVLAAALSAAFASPATGDASQTNGRRDEKRANVKRLWRLYPLDPDGGAGKDAKVGEQGAQYGEGTEQENIAPSPMPAENSQGGNGEGAPGRESQTRWMVVVGAALVAVVGIMTIVRQREGEGEMAPQPAAMVLAGGDPPKAAPPANRVLDGREPTVLQVPEREREAPVPESPRSVRVYLRDGRVIQGRVDQPPTTDSPVLLLEVDSVVDEEGRILPSTPGDSFVPSAQIDQIEKVRNSDEVPRDEVR